MDADDKNLNRFEGGEFCIGIVYRLYSVLPVWRYVARPGLDFRALIPALPESGGSV